MTWSSKYAGRANPAPSWRAQLRRRVTTDATPASASPGAMRGRRGAMFTRPVGEDGAQGAGFSVRGFAPQETGADAPQLQTFTGRLTSDDDASGYVAPLPSAAGAVAYAHPVTPAWQGDIEVELPMPEVNSDAVQDGGRQAADAAYYARIADEHRRLLHDLLAGDQSWSWLVDGLAAPQEEQQRRATELAELLAGPSLTQRRRDVEAAWSTLPDAEKRLSGPTAAQQDDAEPLAWTREHASARAMAEVRAAELDRAKLLDEVARSFEGAWWGPLIGLGGRWT